MLTTRTADQQAVTREPRRQVVVLGTGVVAPGALDVASLVEGLEAGRSFAQELAFEVPGCDVRLGCPVTDFDPLSVMTARDARRSDRASHLALGAAHQALEAIDRSAFAPERGAVVVGVGAGGLGTLAELQAHEGFVHVGPFSIPAVMSNSTAAILSRWLGTTGVSLTVTGACAAGTIAVAEGVRLIRDGTADVVLCVGVDALLIPYAIAGFNRMGALSAGIRTDRTNSRPFDKTRNGFVLGEGAGALVLAAEGALCEPDVPLARVSGIGMTSDAHHMVRPQPDGKEIRRCMRLCLDDAGCEPESVRHVNAHGSSTLLNDSIEGAAIATLFGSATPVTANKGAIGHLLGGAGAVELIASIEAMNRCSVPPISNLSQPDPDIPVDAVMGSARVIESGPFIKNSFAFGGHNASLLVEPWQM